MRAGWRGVRELVRRPNESFSGDRPKESFSDDQPKEGILSDRTDLVKEQKDVLRMF